MERRKFIYISGISKEMQQCIGELTRPFVAIVYGQSGHGKSNFVMQMVYELREIGNILYLSLEEGLEASFQNKIATHLHGKDGLRIRFADASMKLDGLFKILDKRRSASLIVIDSLQYFGISYSDYKHLKERYPSKSWIFISHAKGNYPAGKTADKIRYDAGVKIKVMGKVAFPASRYGGNKPYVIWEEGAKMYFRGKFKSIISGHK